MGLSSSRGPEGAPGQALPRYQISQASDIPTFRQFAHDLNQPQPMMQPQQQYAPIAGQEPVPAAPQSPLGSILGQQAGMAPEAWQSLSNARLYGNRY